MCFGRMNGLLQIKATTKLETWLWNHVITHFKGSFLKNLICFENCILAWINIIKFKVLSMKYFFQIWQWVCYHMICDEQKEHLWKILIMSWTKCES
jgi:hypothetical protein